MNVLDTLAATDNVTYALTTDLRLVGANAAWERFARANGGEQLIATWRPGSSVLPAIPSVLRPFYLAGFDAARRSGERWEHEYECSSPEVFRRFRMIAYPFADGLVVTHSLLVEQPHDRDPHPPAAGYLRDGLIEMCSECRRTLYRAAERWDWIPSYVERRPAHVTDGLCRACLEYYFPA